MEIIRKGGPHVSYMIGIFLVEVPDETRWKSPLLKTLPILAPPLGKNQPIFNPPLYILHLNN